MTYCINPLCAERNNPDNFQDCSSCGTPLLINGRIRLLVPLRELTFDPHSYFEVFEVEDLGTKDYPIHQRRVMKILKWNSDMGRKLIESEFRALLLINHPNIPLVRGAIDFFTFSASNKLLELRCLVMDKIEGENLEDWINKNHSISQDTAIKWLKQLVEILDVVHHTEFFHRDIKPSNIILKNNGQLALIDFGTVRQITSTYLNKLGSAGGTSTIIGNHQLTSVVSPYYTPLEQINGRALLQSDFFALGRTFVHLLTGKNFYRLPIDKKTGRLIWRDKAPQIDKPLANLIEEMMSSVPAQRPQSTEIILQKLSFLPVRTRLYQITRNNFFRVGIGILSLLSIYGLYKLSKPIMADYLFTQGKKSQQESRLNDAKNNFALAIKINPDITYTISKFYVDLSNQRDLDIYLEKQYYELAIKYNDKSDDLYYRLAALCQDMNDYICAKKNYDMVLKLNPHKWQAYYNLGNFYDNLAKYELAEKEYKLAIKISPQAAEPINNLARLKILQGNYSDAILLAQRGLKLSQDNQTSASLFKNLGWAKLQQKKIKEAQFFLKKAEQLRPNTDIYCLLAQTADALVERKESKLYWESCLLTEPDIYLPEITKWRQELLNRLFS